MRQVRFLPYLSIFLPFGIAVFYVYLFGVNVFFADEWDFVVLVEKLHSGTLSIADLFAHHNEHIYFFPWTAMLSLGALTGYDTVPLMYLVQVCLLTTSIILFLAFRRNLSHQPLLYILLFIPVPFLVLGFRQYENMLWGNQISYAFVQTFAVLALFLIYVLEGRDPGKLISVSMVFLAALVSATIASFSAVQGLLVWPAGILQLFIAPIKRSVKSSLLVVWGLIGLAEWIFYFIGDAGTEGLLLKRLASFDPAVAADYFVTMLGGSLFWQDELALSGGLLLICLVVAGLLMVYKSGMLKDNSFWVALLLFSLLSLAALTAGRSGLGYEQVVWAQAIGSRFVIFSILAVVSIYAIFVALAARRRSQVAVAFLGSLLGLMLLSIPTSYLVGVEGGEATKAYREETADILLDYRSQPDGALAKLGNTPKRVKEYAPFLERHGYNAFAERGTIEPQDTDYP